MDEPSKAKRGETREFWEAAIRLWVESGLPVREFCSREGLTEHTFYSWRRELMPERPASEVNQESAGNDRRRRRGRKLLADPVGTNTSAVEFLPVCIVGEEVSRANAASAEMGAAPVEIVGPPPWRVRIPVGFDPATLDAVLTVLERRSC